MNKVKFLQLEVRIDQKKTNVISQLDLEKKLM